MWPGYATVISEENLAAAATITPTKDLVRVTDTSGTTVLATIAPPCGGRPSVMFIQNASGGNITTVTTGNVLTAVTIGNNALVVMCYSVIAGKWIVGALA